MDKKVAVASTDGKVVNEHFGRAAKFFVISYDEDTLKILKVEERKVTPVCHGGSHDENDLEHNIEILSDCDCVLVSRIGERAERKLSKRNISVFELPGIISESIEKMVKYMKVQQLFHIS